MANRNMTEEEKAAAKKAALDEKIKQAQESLVEAQSEDAAEKIEKAKRALGKLYKATGITVPDATPNIGTDSGGAVPEGDVPASENKPVGKTDTGFVELMLRNKTGNKTYYRCGVCIKNDFVPVKIPTADVPRLRSDPWIEEKK